MIQNKKLPIFVLAATAIIALMSIFLTSKISNLAKNKKISAQKVFSSIKDALTKDVSLYCEFGDEKSSFKSYIKNGSVRLTTTGSGENQAGEMLLKNNKMYVWDAKVNKGFVYGVEENNSSSTDASEVGNPNSYLDIIEKHKTSCTSKDINDSLFEIPKDVYFEDMSKLLEDYKKQMPTLDTSK